MALFARKFGRRKMQDRIYLDYAAATPVRDEVLEVMAPYFGNRFANPSAIHFGGVQVRAAVEVARKNLAEVLQVRSEDVVFTSGGTESNNLAVFGVVEEALKDGKQYGDIEIISTKIEHPSLLEALMALEKKGVVVKYAPVNEEGLVELAAFKELLSPKTCLVTIGYVNSEIGVVQDARKISRAIREYKNDEEVPYLHVDASQAPLYLSCSLSSLGADLLTLDAGKCYGPKGVGVLARTHGVKLSSQLYGGDQEFGLRAGTENVPGIIGGVESILIAQKNYKERSEKVTEVRDYFFDLIEANIDGMVVNGSKEKRAPHNVNISIPGIDGEFAVVTLDAKGISASTRSACSGMTGNGSYVIKAMGGDEKRALGTIRFTLGEETTKNMIERAAAALKDHVDAARGQQSK